MPDLDPEKVKQCSQKLSERDKCDIFIYNGDIQRNVDLDFIISVNARKRSDRLRLILVTHGGDPDAAFKIARYFQDKYKRFELLISGLCKSAGTLVAMGAHELAITPYGELGPLDVQIFKEDKISGMHSGLNISEAMSALEKTAINSYLRLITQTFRNSGGVVSFATASKAASDMVAAMYAPVFGQFDPEDVGSRARSMRIAADYGKRLDDVAQNMKPGAIQKLAETYSSHSFVIDRVEATALFKKVREADPLELELVGALGSCARWPMGAGKPVFECLTEQGDDNAEPPEPPAATAGADRPDGANSGGAGSEDVPKPRRARTRNGGRSPASDILVPPAGG